MGELADRERAIAETRDHEFREQATGNDHVCPRPLLASASEGFNWFFMMVVLGAVALGLEWLLSWVNP